MAAGDLRLPGGAAPEVAALFEEAGSRRTVDGPVDAPAAEQLRIGGVHDGVHGNPGDVAPHHGDTIPFNDGLHPSSPAGEVARGGDKPIPPGLLRHAYAIPLSTSTTMKGEWER